MYRDNRTIDTDKSLKGRKVGRAGQGRTGQMRYRYLNAEFFGEKKKKIICK